MLFAKVSFWQIFAKSFSQHIWNFIHNRELYKSVLWQYVEWFLCPLKIYDNINIFCFSDVSYTPGFTSIVVNRDLENVLKIDVLTKKTEDHQVTKMVLQMVSIYVSRLLCRWQSFHISKRFRPNMAVPVEFGGKLDYWTKLY